MEVDLKKIGIIGFSSFENGGIYQYTQSLIDGLILDKSNKYVIFTKSNADTDGRIINRMIDDFVSKRQKKSVVHASLGQLNYLSAIQYMDGVVGNSSSGIIEVPSFKVGTINVGDRQLGRIKAASIIDCKPSYDGVQGALNKLFSSNFQRKVISTVNPYGGGGASEKIIQQIREISLQGILKKSFYNLKIKET